MKIQCLKTKKPGYLIFKAARLSDFAVGRQLLAHGKSALFSYLKSNQRIADSYEPILVNYRCLFLSFKKLFPAHKGNPDESGT